MKKAHKTFQTFMEDALQKSLPELALVKSRAPSSAKPILSARLGFEGQGMTAQAFLSCTEDFLRLTCPLPRESGAEHPESVLKDWLGELGNLILGRLKNRLLAHEVTIRISAPDLNGPWTRSPNAETITVWFASGTSMIGFDCAIEGQIPEIGEAAPQSAEILPGDAIYRLNDTTGEALSVDLLSQIRSGVASTEAAADPLADELPELAEKPLKAPTKAFPIHFHKAKEAPAPKSQTTLCGIAWPKLDSLQLKFSSGLELTISPKALFDQGTTQLEIEGNSLHIALEGDTLRISLPKLHMTLSQSMRQAG